MSLKFFAFLSLAILVSFTVALPYHTANFATTLGKSGYFKGKPFLQVFQFYENNHKQVLKNSAKTNVTTESSLRHWCQDETDTLIHTLFY